MMKQLVFKTILVFLLVNIWNSQLIAETELPAFKQNTIRKDFVKTIKKDFPISERGEVTLSNKYGEVNVKTWDRNQVGIEVNITVNSRDEKTAQVVFDRIGVDFSNGGDFVKAETSISSQKKSSWSWWGNSSKHDFTIDYQVYMPETCELAVQNKYGNTFIEEIDNEVRLSVKYGNFRLDASRELNVNLGYGNGTVIKTGDVNAEVSYGKLRVNEANEVDILSKYSKVYIDKGEDVKTTSKYDTYSVGTIGDFTNTGKYDNIEIVYAENVNALTKYSSLAFEKVGSSAIFEMQYGSAKISHLEKGFSEVRINGKYTDFKVHVDPAAQYQLDVSTTYASIYYNEKLNVTYELSKGKEKALEGYMGSKGGGKIKARLNYGGVKIK